MTLGKIFKDLLVTFLGSGPLTLYLLRFFLLSQNILITDVSIYKQFSQAA